MNFSTMKLLPNSPALPIPDPLLTNQPFTHQGCSAVLYSGLASPAGILLAFYSIKQYGATAAAMISYIVPVVATIGGMLFLAETFTLAILAGMVLSMLGITIVHQS